MGGAAPSPAPWRAPRGGSERARSWSLSWPAQEKFPVVTVHVGRATFPADYARRVTPQWVHRNVTPQWVQKLIPKGQVQVWCKNNWTSADIKPWPLPPTQMDFASNVTLTYLHESELKFGRPKPNKYRGDSVRHEHKGYKKVFDIARPQK